MSRKKNKIKQNEVSHKQRKEKTEVSVSPFGQILGKALSESKENGPLDNDTHKKTELENKRNTGVNKEKKTSPLPVSKKIRNVDEKRNWEKEPNRGRLKINFDKRNILDSNQNIDYTSQNPEYCYQTQLSESAEDESELIIGLDFGTSCTKAVIRDNSLQKSYAVPFCDETPCLISTKLFVNSSGVCGLEKGCVTGDEEIDDIKIALIENPNEILFTDKASGQNIRAKELAVSYIALIVREIRYWFFKEHREKYINNELVWELNIGLPSRSYGDENLCNTFRTVALAGWNVSVQDAPVSFDLAKSALKDAESNLVLILEKKEIAINYPELHPESVNVIPEVISEIVGYAKSSLRREGLHLLVDIGAGTIDVTSFILYLDKDNNEISDLFTLLTTEVELYGAFMLHKHRLESVKNIIECKLNQLFHSVDGMKPLPKNTDYLVSKANFDMSLIDEEFIKKFRGILMDVISITKKKRDPNSEHWKEGLPVFLCGGGSQIELYKQATRDCSDSFSRNGSIEKFNFMDIPIPDGLEAPNLTKKNYHRIAVAYGLSFSFDDVGKIIPPNQVENINTNDKTRDFSNNYIGSEMV